MTGDLVWDEPKDLLRTQGAWQDYRLGDMVTQKYYRRCEDGEKLHMSKYPDSIASRYMRRTKHESRITIVADIVRRWAPSNDDVPTWDWVVHVRGGDVLEDTIALDETHERVVHGEGGLLCGVTPEQLLSKRTNYVRSVDEIMLDFQPSPSDRDLHVCIVTGGCHVLSAPKTKKYVHLLATRFLQHPKVKRVTVRFFHSPDDDFVLMCSAPKFIPSGGMFTRLVLETRRQAGVVRSRRRRRVG